MFDGPTFVITSRELHMACSQERMAQELGVCAKTISNWERGVVQPQWRHKSRLLVLGVGYKVHAQTERRLVSAGLLWWWPCGASGAVPPSTGYHPKNMVGGYRATLLASTR